MAVPANRANVATRLSRDTHLHREVEHRVIVFAELPCGRQPAGQVRDPSFSSRFSVIGPSFQTSQPPRYVAVDDYCSTIAVKRQPCRCGVGTDAWECSQFRISLWRTAAPRGNQFRRPVQERPTPMQPNFAGDLARNRGAGQSERSRGRKPVSILTEHPLRLESSRSLNQHFCNESQPWI